MVGGYASLVAHHLMSLRILCLTVTDTLQYGNGDGDVYNLRIAVRRHPHIVHFGYKGTQNP